MENNAYLQSWIEAIQNKPDALIRAVKEADRATNYMEYKVGIIPESEYKRQNSLEKITTGKSTSQTSEIENLSSKLTSFAGKYDPYEFKDIETTPGQINNMTKQDLAQNITEPYKDYLNSVLQDSSRPDIKTEALDIKNEIEALEKSQTNPHPFRMHF